MQTVTLTPLFRESIGFDRFNDFFESVLNNTDVDKNNSCPPYDIEKHGENDYRITLAVAGFDIADLNIITQNNILTICGEIKEEKQEAVQYLHKTIASSAFQHKFNLSDYMVVKGASLNNGLLKIDLVREVPETSKPRTIEIKSDKTSNVSKIEDQGEKKKPRLAA